ncbi:outer membrane lipoprotein chaperone LolA [Thorsellia kenyensis]|uniref:Outer-membrane lipoprotein carrier protein n=1 Tax=Thorsellia kenyensis TaxID=1549888 RepID=A0ABV6CB14_9GAMM
MQKTIKYPKKFSVLKTLFLLSVFGTLSVYADASKTLKSRLDEVSAFQASFTQQVRDADNALIQEAEGDVWVRRPNLFRWHTLVPDESILVSDGKTLWFYNPFVEQVTATNLNDATTNTPFKLIASNRDSDWSQYNIKQKGNNFSLTPKSSDNNIKSFDINVTSAGIIESFNVIEQDGQKIEYQLKKQNSLKIEDSYFTFELPDGVEFDDQR